jgi:hypothetical protein
MDSLLKDDIVDADTPKPRCTFKFNYKFTLITAFLQRLERAKNQSRENIDTRLRPRNGNF